MDPVRLLRRPGSEIGRMEGNECRVQQAEASGARLFTNYELRFGLLARRRRGEAERMRSGIFGARAVAPIYELRFQGIRVQKRVPAEQMRNEILGTKVVRI